MVYFNNAIHNTVDASFFHVQIGVHYSLNYHSVYYLDDQLY